MSAVHIIIICKINLFMKPAFNSPAITILQQEPVSRRNSICNNGTKFIAAVTINWHRWLNVFTHCIFKSDHEKNPSNLSFHRVKCNLTYVHCLTAAAFPTFKGLISVMITMEIPSQTHNCFEFEFVPVR